MKPAQLRGMRYQQGELSLRWTFILMALAAFCAVAVLYWARYERNLFAETLQGATNSLGQAVKPAVEKAGQAVKPAADKAGLAMPADNEIRRCTVDGKVVYSNVECRTADRSSKAVDIRDSRGFEPPPAPPKESMDEPADPNHLIRRKMGERLP